MILSKGSKLICPECGTEVFKLKIDIDDDRAGGTLFADEIEGLNGYEPKVGECPRCPKCNTAIYMYDLESYKKSDN